MGIKFFIFDDNGTHLSADGKKKYALIQGQALEAFLDSPNATDRHFIMLSDDKGQKYAIETSLEHACDFNKDKDRCKYLRKVKVECNITFISGNTPVDEDDEIELMDTIPDESVDIEAQVLNEENLERLSQALKKLKPEEYELINDLFFRGKRLSQKELTLKYGISQQAISKRKNAILKKLKEIF